MLADINRLLQWAQELLRGSALEDTHSMIQWNCNATNQPTHSPSARKYPHSRHRYQDTAEHQVGPPTYPVSVSESEAKHTGQQ